MNQCENKQCLTLRKNLSTLKDKIIATNSLLEMYQKIKHEIFEQKKKTEFYEKESANLRDQLDALIIDSSYSYYFSKNYAKNLQPLIDFTKSKIQSDAMIMEDLRNKISNMEMRVQSKNVYINQLKAELSDLTVKCKELESNKSKETPNTKELMKIQELTSRNEELKKKCKLLSSLKESSDKTMIELQRKNLELEKTITTLRAVNNNKENATNSQPNFMREKNTIVDKTPNVNKSNNNTVVIQPKEIIISNNSREEPKSTFAPKSTVINPIDSAIKNNVIPKDNSQKNEINNNITAPNPIDQDVIMDDTIDYNFDYHRDDPKPTPTKPIDSVIKNNVVSKDNTQKNEENVKKNEKVENKKIEEKKIDERKVADKKEKSKEKEKEKIEIVQRKTKKAPLSSSNHNPIIDASPSGVQIPSSLSLPIASLISTPSPTPTSTPTPTPISVNSFSRYYDETEISYVKRRCIIFYLQTYEHFKLSLKDIPTPSSTNNVTIKIRPLKSAELWRRSEIGNYLQYLLFDFGKPMNVSSDLSLIRGILTSFLPFENFQLFSSLSVDQLKNRKYGDNQDTLQNSKIPTTYFKSLLKLILLMLTNIDSKTFISNYLKESAIIISSYSQDEISPQLRLTCKIFTKVCKLRGEISRLRVLIFDLLRIGEFNLKLIYILIKPWHIVLAHAEENINLLAIEMAISSNYLKMSNSNLTKETFELIQSKCNWDKSFCSLSKPELFEQFFKQKIYPIIFNNNTANSNSNSHFHALKAIELVSVYSDWDWIFNCIVIKYLSPHLLATNEQFLVNSLKIIETISRASMSVGSVDPSDYRIGNLRNTVSNLLSLANSSLQIQIISVETLLSLSFGNIGYLQVVSNWFKSLPKLSKRAIPSNLKSSLTLFCH